MTHTIRRQDMQPVPVCRRRLLWSFVQPHRKSHTNLVSSLRVTHCGMVARRKSDNSCAWRLLQTQAFQFHCVKGIARIRKPVWQNFVLFWRKCLRQDMKLFENLKLISLRYDHAPHKDRRSCPDNAMMYTRVLVRVLQALRAEIWPILLGLSAESLESEFMLTPIDLNVLGRSSVLDEKTRKQIDVDLPRCHQENAILASTEGQTCLRFVLEAWLETHLQSSDYCQGLDSLAAPFVTLFFHRCCVNTDLSETARDQVVDPADACDPQADEAAGLECSQNKRGAPCMRLAVQPAYCCLVAFTGRFLDQIFASGSTSMLRAQLAEFSELLSAELPQLASHFRDEGVTVELFAIPWLLTLFAHVLPLPNVLQLWDVLLTHGDDPRAESLPLYVAISVLRQSEAHLVTLDFNGMLLHLSRLPPIDLDCALRDAVVKWTAGSTADAL